MNHSVWRDNKTQKDYKTYASAKRTDTPCEFCILKSGDGQVIEEAGTFWIARNMFPYTIWDSFFVSEHFMLIPKRHTDSIGKFTPEELVEFGNTIARYEAKGYSIYGRAATNSAKSIAHQHTHLIKISGKKIRSLIFVRRLGFTRFY